MAAPLRHAGSTLLGVGRRTPLASLTGPPSWQRQLLPPLPLARRSFATTVFSVKPRKGEAAGEQTLFVVGLNKGKFFGQDGAEEALKLLERIAEHSVPGQGPQYHLLFGISERELKALEDDHQVKNQRLTPSRELESRKLGEFVPVMQAGMVDQRPRRALSRVLKVSQGHVSWQLWRHPREAVKIYWLYWQKNQYKDAALRKFWMKHLPVSAYAYFMEIAYLVATRATELMVTSYRKNEPRTWVLVVSNEFFEPTTERLASLLDNTASERFSSREFPRHIKETADELCVDMPDFTPMLLFVYLALPCLVIQSVLLAVSRVAEYYKVPEMVIQPEFRE